ncbi:hypothetical protein HYPBUDRAFT_132406 [Hyphopichia burtonii NRRL Y-1933]|uniref:Spindle assembly checkpoint component MAD1 n=1 Tax=Hyphopichia burtonii NRRL Y-1933 TaxID=984485 RepID=A0A1E4RRI5_9ASCO|nr:hypothetical protein HYPBUDRAFT_132406 [Hyphopichia burtonii NRRL Y-1933]ODV69883.1 hypothetical protein HYPBUDRAFT_132406 [Hyphopichia burtonii NRRL Y-1933]
MTDTGSSPFVEHPRDVFNEESVLGLKQIISSLQFQLSSTKSEKSLLEQSKESLSKRYEEIISKKNEDLSSLEQNVEFLYKEREQLRDKVENQKQIFEQQRQELSQEIDELKGSNSRLLSKNDKLEFKLNNINAKYEHIKSDFNYELSNNDQLNGRIKSLELENKRLSEINDEFSNNLNLAADQLSNDRSLELQTINDNLQRTNSQLQLKVDKLLQHKTSTELLKQKNISLSNKVSRLESFEQKCWSLSVENTELKSKFDDYFKIINEYITHEDNDTNESVVMKFVNKLKDLKNNNLVLFDKYSQTQTKLTQSENKLQNLHSKIQHEYLPKIDSLSELNLSKDLQIKKLQDQKMLNNKEIEFLRNSLKNFDRIEASKIENERKENNNPSSEATNQYLSNLEKLVDQYKLEIDSLQKQAVKSSSSIGEKRPRIVDDAMEVKSMNINTSLDRENVKLQTQVKNLEDEINRLNDKIQSNEKVESQRESIHMVQLKSNPFSKDQLVKQQSLDLLIKENQDLIKKFVEGIDDESIDLIPKSVFARQEQDKAILQTKVDQLTKKIHRLKTIYADKSKDILSIISKYFGYTIEFIPSPINPNDLSSRIKLVSRYLSNKDNSAPSNAYLILDLNSKSLKANGNLEFKSLCEDLVSNWVNEKGQIPCFLSALNLKIYETYVLS